jgi:lipopolysaccharide export LptBFGC system permease protein LptF
MKWIVMVLLMSLCILLVICYSLMVVAHDADERAEEMAREWVEANREIVDSLQVGTISAKNIKYIEWKEIDDERGFDKEV